VARHRGETSGNPDRLEPLWAQSGTRELEAFVDKMTASGQAPTPLEIVVTDLQVRKQLLETSSRWSGPHWAVPRFP
jgi:hypothetical protein